MEEPSSDFKNITLTVKHFKNKSCIIYGKSGSGKSHIIKHALYLLRTCNPTVIVFSSSERDNSAYSQYMIPRCFVHDTVTPELLDAIAARQTKARAIYERVNSLDTLHSLFDHIANSEQRNIRDELVHVYE